MSPLDMFTYTSTFTTIVAILHWCIMIGLGFRIILKRHPSGVTFAWLFVVASLPFFGAAMYLLVGELWLPKRRIHRYNSYKGLLSDAIRSIDEQWDIKGEALSPIARQLNAQAHHPMTLSAIGGNSIKIYDTDHDCFDAIIDDIDRAESSVSMLFYIWESSGEVCRVEEALLRAAGRGVHCRVMVDSAGSKGFVRSSSARVLRDGGAEVIETLPVGLMRVLFARIDIRNHRKIITVDHHIAYTGSMNMVDSSVFHAGKGVGRWVDVMARVEGPAARVLDMTFHLDWAVESMRDPCKEFRSLIPEGVIEASGESPLQVVPSGPDQAPRVIHDMLLTLVYNASEQIVITTPYFIPSEAMLSALTAAAMRGVEVTLVVPKRVDSILVRIASKSYFDDLIEAGVKIRLFRGGLLHSKTVTADGTVGLLGTVNMDKRSFWINFEISLFAYDTDTVRDLRHLQGRYIADSDAVEPDEWKSRSLLSRVTQNTVQLLAPIL
jgi:cardiolipin synthase A/B